MNYNEQSIKKKREDLLSKKKKVRTTASVITFRIILFFICAVFISGAGFLYGSFQGIIDSAPEDFSLAPKYSATIVYDDNNKVVQQLSDYSSNRISITYEQIPDNLKNAFISIEEERFYEHDGIDFNVILRALWAYIRKA